jgi:hypothetical protein
LFLLLGLGVLVAGNSGGCPVDFANWLAPADDDAGDADDTDGTDDPNDTDGTDDPNSADATDGADTETTLHEKIFTEILGKTAYEGTADSCLICHSDHARDILETAHWNWEGPVTDIEGFEDETHGKRDLMNNL